MVIDGRPRAATRWRRATRRAASKSFEALVLRYPETPNVHYAYGVYLLLEQPDKAIDEFKKELELQPGIPHRSCRSPSST